ncbi:MAG: hypothetical protein ACRCSP_02285 [Rhodoglobus sp.]
MIHLGVSLPHYLLPAEIVVPAVEPDFSAPFMVGLQVVVSYILAAGLIIVLGILIVAICSLAFRGITPEKIQSWAGENIARVAIAVVILGSVSGIFQWLVNFNFGF